MSWHKRFWAGGVSCVLLLTLIGCHNPPSLFTVRAKAKSPNMSSEFSLGVLHGAPAFSPKSDIDFKPVTDFLGETLAFDHRWRWRHQDIRLQREEEDRDWGWMPPPWLFTEAGEVNEVKDVAEVRRGGIFARYRQTGNH